MLRGLLLEELAISAFGDDLHRIIFGRWPVKPVPECLSDYRSP
jgi:hypothetical protein